MCPIVRLKVLNWLLLSYVLPEDAIRMPLEIEMLTKLVDCFTRREDCLEVALSILLFLKVRQYRHVILGQLSETIEEGWDRDLVANAV